MISDKAQREWLQERMEPSRNRPELGPEDRVGLLERLIAAETFEQFLHTSYVGQKRFSLEGGEALIPLLDTVVEEAAAQATEELVMGMPHRGRLNVLAHILRKPYELILAEFEGSFLPWETQGDGDVKYHLGYSHDHVSRAGRPIHLSMSSNPSHLEAVDAVVEGIVRAKQSHRGADQARHVMPVLLHGDAAFLGQGSVYETLMMSRLPSFTTGGTIHVIINNQIGFTTSPVDYRFTRYPSDPAGVVQVPVFHVNGDDPEAAVQAARLAVGFRQAFQTDVFIDFVCYRRHGHNELDDPTFTQPVMYRAIDGHPSVAELYRERLTAEGIVEPGRAEQAREAVKATLRAALAAARERMPQQKVLAFGGLWKGLSWAGKDWSAATAVPAERLRAIADAARRLPPGFTPHKRIPALLEARHAMVERGEGIDWGCAEALAYGSLLLEGTPVRLSGQDTIRGTFSHRHAMLFDAETGASHVPLNHLAADQARIEVVNSPLSEFGVVGFEYGMASADPRRLVIWEAQFGDFFNGAQVIIDQFLASAESKWQRQNGLVLLLPHGYEGQGPEHSSARPERFLQLCAEGQHAGRQLLDAGPVLPRAPASDAPALPEAADRDEPQESAPSPAGRLASGRLRDGSLPVRAGRSASAGGRGDPTRAPLLRQDLLHARPGPRGTGLGRDRDHPARSALPVPSRGAHRRVTPLFARHRLRLGAGGAGQPGRVELRTGADRGAAGRAPAPVHRPCRGREPGHRQLQDPRVGRARTRGAGAEAATDRAPGARRGALAGAVRRDSGVAAMTTEVRIPQLGESVTEGTIARWLKQDGDVVNAEEPVLELETDKATMEIPAGASGQISIIEPQGAVVHVGTVVARITEGAPAAIRAAKTSPPAAPPLCRARRPTRPRRPNRL